ncbi:MAG: GGDEF domain-containing protein [Propionivibrio sp.]|uniref:GGDEF domain-containing protein n=1 Tax=Propionivibrio sp. TaxID=2212460 RepID=UPI001A443F9E|nr:GGDEF domain-containing protein [Propionivibrio sp.]MBL8415268.1 GGDEF domain-containing protein [Propionivibrio sp.]
MIMPDQSILERLNRLGWPTGKAFALLCGVFVSIFLALVLWLAVDQRLVLEGAERLQDKTVPSTLEHFRLARNIEQLRLEGERVLSGRSPVERQQAMFIVSLIASHPAMLADARASALAREVESFLTRSAREGLSEKNNSEWVTLTNRLSLLADDLSIEGVNLETEDLRHMTTTMLQSHIKLAVVLALVAVFVGSFLFLIHRHLIRPLQMMSQTLSELRFGQPPSPVEASAMLEIREVEAAIGQLQKVMLENEQARQRLEFLATTDSLTSMFNRRHFMTLAEEEIKRAHRYARPICVGMADLDFFKRINDSYGHAVGDVVLQSMTALFAKALRHSDWVCRYGGEEFAFVFPETTPIEAQHLAERLRHFAAENRIELSDGICLRITLSVGLADASAGSLDEALKRADEALYEAKSRGRNRVVMAAASDIGERIDEIQVPANERSLH